MESHAKDVDERLKGIIIDNVDDSKGLEVASLHRITNGFTMIIVVSIRPIRRILEAADPQALLHPRECERPTAPPFCPH